MSRANYGPAVFELLKPDTTHLISAFRHPPSVFCLPSSALCHLPSVICHLSSEVCPLTSVNETPGISRSPEIPDRPPGVLRYQPNRLPSASTRQVTTGLFSTAFRDE